MAETPRLHIPYPIDNDAVDVPRDIKAVADRLDLITADLPIQTGDIQNDAITGGKIDASVFAPWITIAEATSAFGTPSDAGRNVYRPGGYVIPEGSAQNIASIFYFRASDYALPGRTLRVRQRATWIGNSTSPGVGLSFTFTQNKLSGNGGPPDQIIPVLTSTVLCPQVVHTPAVPGNTLSSVGASSATPEDGFYAFCVTVAGAAVPANLMGNLHSRVEYQHV